MEHHKIFKLLNDLTVSKLGSMIYQVLNIRSTKI